MKAWIALASLCFSTLSQASSFEQKVREAQEAMGKPLQHVEVQLLSGEPVSMSSLEGKETVIYFFASWCSPCYGALKNIESVRQQQPLAVNLVAMALDEDAEAVSLMLKQTGYTGVVWQAVDGVQSLHQRAFANGVKALPYLIKVDADGLLAENNYNIKSVAQWKRVLVDNQSLQDAMREEN